MAHQSRVAVDSEHLDFRFRVGPSVLVEFAVTRTRGSLAEPVQNEYDAGGTDLVIKFGPDALVVLPNGKTIDNAGWRRLSVMLGQRHRVELLSCSPDCMTWTADSVPRADHDIKSVDDDGGWRPATPEREMSECECRLNGEPTHGAWTVGGLGQTTYAPIITPSTIPVCRRCYKLSVTAQEPQALHCWTSYHSWTVASP